MKPKNQPTKQVKELPTADLIPYARNAKKHDDAQVAKIAGSIREFGFNNPVLIDGKNGIIAGHGRVMAAQKLGLEQVPCIRLDHLSETQKQAYILADNRLAEIGGGWDMEALKIELAELADADIDLDALGFGEDFTKAFEVEETGMPELAEGDKQPFQQMTFTVHDEQVEEVKAALAKAKAEGHGESVVNENSNGNALAWICQSFNRNEG
jgi:ParB family chromosome partitioning protein